MAGKGKEPLIIKRMKETKFLTTKLSKCISHLKIKGLKHEYKTNPPISLSPGHFELEILGNFSSFYYLKGKTIYV